MSDAVVKALQKKASLSAYQPTFREKASDVLRALLFSDDREGQRKAERLSTVLETVTPYGVATGIDDMREAAGQGDYATAGMMGAMAMVPGPSPKIKGYHGSPHSWPAERLVRMPDGSQQYLVGSGNALPDLPPGAEAIKDFPLGRARLDKIGTGEGAQAYGHGLYFAENEGVAKGYRDTLAGGKVEYKGAIPQKGTLEDAIAAYIAKYGNDHAIPELRKELSKHPQFKNEVAQLDAGKFSIEDFKLSPGSMYEVEINASPDDFLDWDALPWEQTPQVQAKLARAGIDPNGYPRWTVKSSAKGDKWTVYNVWGEASGTYGSKEAAERKALEGTRKHNEGWGANFYRQAKGSGPADRSKTLLDAGIPGIRYADAGSRGAVTTKDADIGYLERLLKQTQDIAAKATGAAKAEADLDVADVVQRLADAKAEKNISRNYVVFDENLINIVRKYGIAGASAMLGYNLLDSIDPAQAKQLEQLEQVRKLDAIFGGAQ